MLAILGAVAFGALFTGAWISAEQAEKKSRDSSRKDNCEFYIDKNGIMRHTGSGRKYTVEEVHKTFFDEEKSSYYQYKRENEEMKKLKYWTVEVLAPGSCIHKEFHIFLNKEEAEAFLEQALSEGRGVPYQDKVRNSDQFYVDTSKKLYDTFYHY